MPLLQPKNLFLSSLLLLLLAVGCSPTHGYKLKERAVVTEKQVHPVVSADSSRLYKARINLFSKYYTGLILLKQTNPTTAHLVFVTELGMKMFDFEVRNNELKLVYVFEPLNRPEIIKLLESDMKLLLLQHLLNKEAEVYEKPQTAMLVYKTKGEKGNNYYLANSSLAIVNKAIVKGRLFVKERVEYGYGGTEKVNYIKLKHKGLIRLSIELTAISKNI